MQASFSRLAVVNRGEPAMRLIHAVHEVNQDRSDPIKVIALFTESERDAMFVRHADEAVCLGPSLVDDGRGGRRVGYLDYAALERALRQSRADSAWVGWGFVAEQPEFVDLCERLGITFVGPGASVMRLLGDKIAAKKLAEEAGVPVAAWSGGPVQSADDAARHAGRIGFPLMIKAAAGGGGRGIRRVEGPESLASAFASARSEALQAFGDGTLLMEKVIAPARHIEVQIIADGEGQAWAVGVRDCSFQRRNQKVIEESASPALSSEQEHELMDAAVRLALLAGYRNAGTVEFLYEPENREFSFMEVNTRLQVEHPVTEAVTGLDLVKLQLHVAAGGRLEGAPPHPAGHAIEARLNAEDPALGFAPAPGRLALLRLPTGPGIRVDTGVVEGDVIPEAFDSMIGKLVAWGRDRDEAVARLRRAVADTVVVVEGGTTNQGFLLELLDRPEVRTGSVDTAWLDRLYLRGEAIPVRHGDVALLQAAIALADEDTAADRAHFFAFARRGRPDAAEELSRTYDLSHRGHSYRLLVSQIGPERYRVQIDGSRLEISTHKLGAHERRLQLGLQAHRTLTSWQGDDLLVEVDGVPHRITRGDAGTVRNLSPAVVVSIPVRVGDIVQKGDVVAVVEAMKMESSLTAPFDGRVKEIFAAENVHAAARAPLVSLAPVDAAAVAASADTRISFEPDDGETAARQRCPANLDLLRWALLGYDIEPADVEPTVADLQDACGDPSSCDPALITGEHELIGVFADLCAVSRARRYEEEGTSQLLQSPQEHLHAWLRSLDAEGEGLPPSFVAQLEKALSHYGLESLERTPELEEASHRLFLAKRRSSTARTAILAMLGRRLELAGELVGNVGDDFREVLDRLVIALEGTDSVLADLARDVRYRYFDAPVIDAARDAAYAEMSGHIEALISDPERDDRSELLRAIVECPRPLAPLLTSSMRTAPTAARRLLVEATARRYYRVRPLEEFTLIQLGDHEAVATEYDLAGGRRHLYAAYVELDDVERVAREFAQTVSSLPDGELANLDLYAAHHDAAPSHGQLAERLRDALSALPTPSQLHRIIVAVAEPRRGRGMSAVDLLTFRPGPDGLAEHVIVRGLHPMMGERLKLWRFREFHLERLPSAEDIYLFHGTARVNPKDERLFALAEVRDLTAVRDEQGRTVSLPELEQTLVQVFETLRGYQAQRPLSRRLLWNRVRLYVWPVLDFEPEHVRTLLSRLAPLTTGLGLEMVMIEARIRDADGTVREKLLRFFTPTGHDIAIEVDDPPTEPLHPFDEGAQRIISARRRGTLHPAEVVHLLAPLHTSAGQPAGKFIEHDLTEDGQLVAVDRPPATNTAGIVVGTIRNYTERYPEGMLRVILLGDPTRALGSLAEPECRRIIAAIELAERLHVPLEWFALSAGAKIAMDSGTEAMDWIADVLRRIVLFTQAGGELNVIVAGINVGAQPYWNAEATMLMHTTGALIMTPDSAMVLTGKQAIDYSGGVSAEDNFGIGGYERIMGPNGQAQYWAPDLAGACRVLLDYYEHCYVAPGERFPRQAVTSDPPGRDVGEAVHDAPGSSLLRIADVFSEETNPGRKQPFDIRSVMRAVVDRDHRPLERWAAMHNAENAVVWDAHLGGWPVSVIGIESRPLPRHGSIPADGPEQWTSGTLFPRSSKKIARAINAAAGRRPVVVLANLAGFDASPESMREWQLEFGAEIGRAVVNFDGPIIFCVVSRYHGGAFVVFSQRLNPRLEAVALQGTHASVIGGAPAATVVFARDVERAAAADPRIRALDERIAATDGTERQRLRGERGALWTEVLVQKRGEFAERFDRTHSVERAVSVGSVSQIIEPASMRRYLIDAVGRGMAQAARDSHQRERVDGDERARMAEPARG